MRRAYRWAESCAVVLPQLIEKRPHVRLDSLEASIHRRRPRGADSAGTVESCEGPQKN
jgi:hypothetical protein